MSDETKNIENAETPEKKKGSKVLLVVILTLALAGATAAGIYFIWRSAGYLTTDNARVTTTQFNVIPPISGRLERFNLHEGLYVSQNDIIGWVEGGETMRVPFDGIVIDTSVRQGQQVSSHERIAVIADVNNIHIEAQIEETDIGRIQRGQRAYVTIDTFGNEQFVGYISEIGRITAAELSGQAMFFNTGGNFTRVVHLIPIEITLEGDMDLDNFIGVNARVRIPLR